MSDSDSRLEILIESRAKQAVEELDKLTDSIVNMREALSGATGNVTKSFDSMDKSYQKTSKNIQNESGNIVKSIAKISATVYTLRKAFRGLGKSIKSAMDYRETVHLFETVFNRLGAEASDDFRQGFEDRINQYQSKMSILGLDPDALMNYQAVFAQMSRSMGVASDTSYELSESLTSLGADLSSLYNRDVKDMMVKLQSGLSGQIRPLRELGIDISKTTIMEEARRRGIQKSVEVMSASEKVQLRYLAIMRQTRVAMGDMASTIDRPANQLRILKQQWEQATRAMGNLFLPMVQKIMPYLIALTMMIQRIANGIARLFGVSLPSPKLDYNAPLGVDWEDEADGVDEVTGKVKKLKNLLMGFDEINLLGSSSDTGATSGMGVGASFDLSKEIAEENRKYQELIDQAMGDMKNKAKDIADNIQKTLEPLVPFFQGFGDVVKYLWDKLKGFKETPFYNWLTKIGDWMRDNPDTLRSLGQGLGAVVAGLGAFKSLKWLGEVTGISKLVTWLKKLLFGTKDVTSAFGKKNKKLSEQTEATTADAYATEGLTATVGALLGAVTALGVYLNGNPLDVDVPDLQPVLDAYLGVEPQVSESFNLMNENVMMATRNLESGLDLTSEQIQEYLTGRSSETVRELEGNSSTLVNFIEELLGTHELNVGALTSSIALLWASNLTGGFVTSGENARLVLDAIQKNAGTFGLNLLMASALVGKNFTYNFGSSFLNVNENFINFAKTFLGNAVEFGIGFSKVAFNIGKNFVNSLVGALGKVWNAFKKFAKAMGIKLSGFFSENKDFFVETGVALAMGALVGATILAPESAVVTAPAMIALSTIPKLATGGLVDSGQLFVANETGPELVGSFGDKTAVMNNDQIVESVSEGVYRAVSSALMINSTGTRSGDREIVISVDGDRLARVMLPSLNHESMRMGYQPILQEV